MKMIVKVVKFCILLQIFFDLRVKSSISVVVVFTENLDSGIYLTISR